MSKVYTFGKMPEAMAAFKPVEELRKFTYQGETVFRLRFEVDERLPADICEVRDQSGRVLQRFRVK